MNRPLWLTESEVTSLLDLPVAIAALEDGLRQQSAGLASAMKKTHASWGGGSTLHAIGATFPAARVVGTKTWAHTHGGAAPLLVLFDAENGSVRAVIEAFALGQLRTAAVSAVATRYLAKPDAATLAIAGSGKQAFSQVRAVAAVRPLRRVLVWSRTLAHADSLAARVRDELSLDASAVRDFGVAAGESDVITLVTRSTAPFLTAAAPAKGAHVNAIGAIVPSRVEFEPALLDRATSIVSDDLAQSKELSAEFGAYFGEGSEWVRVQRLCDVVSHGGERPADADLTLLKAMGSGLSDVAIGLKLLDLATGTPAQPSE